MHYDAEVPIGAFLDTVRWTCKVQDQMYKQSGIGAVYMDSDVLMIHK